MKSLRVIYFLQSPFSLASLSTDLSSALYSPKKIYFILKITKTVTVFVRACKIMQLLNVMQIIFQIFEKKVLFFSN